VLEKYFSGSVFKTLVLIAALSMLVIISKSTKSKIIVRRLII
jgi:hypothetical protein